MHYSLSFIGHQLDPIFFIMKDLIKFWVQKKSHSQEVLKILWMLILDLIYGLVSYQPFGHLFVYVRFWVKHYQSSLEQYVDNLALYV